MTRADKEYDKTSFKPTSGISMEELSTMDELLGQQRNQDNSLNCVGQEARSLNVGSSDYVNHDPVNPKHYSEMKISPLEYIKANELEWNVGNVIKYISRYKMKNGLEDLKKSRWYLDDLIKDMEEQL